MSGYIGTQPVPQATQTRDSFTCTAGQTSFATSGFTPNFLDVYLNGVKLAATDYTASNGSDVVLASGAAAGDVLEVVAYTAFEAANVTGATDFTVTGSFTSQGIDDNATSTAMTLDGSGNVLVGKTADNWGTTGVQVHGYGVVAASRNGYVINANRENTDGDIAVFRKDGSSVGSIGAFSSSNFGITGSAPNKGGLVFATSEVLPAKNGTYSSSTVDLGNAGTLFKDLYLSGGVYLGGTGSANKLDDVETGTFSPSILAYYGNNPVISYFRQQGNYTKVGDLVHVNIMLDIGSASNLSGDLIMVGPLPFAISPGVEAEGVSNTSAWTPQRGNNISIGCHSITQSYMGFLTSNPGSGWGWEPTSIMPTGASALRLSMTYITA